MTPPSPALDRLLLDALKDAHNRGAELYNAGDPDAALRLYQGALLVARPLLAHRPAAAAAAADGLADVDRSTADVRVKAFRLHEAIEMVRGVLKARPDADPPAG